jgi:GNAT superfamily N-acetyltransferase
MNKSRLNLSKLKFKPLEKSNWKDFVKLFGENGACGGCWCMSWRLKSSDFEKNKGELNKTAFKKIVYKNEEPGLIAYLNDEPVAWCAVAPREKYIRLENSRVLKRIDKEPVWSITCFYIQKPFRGQGLSVAMLKSVIEFCKTKKVKIIEGYPVIPYSQKIPGVFAWTGIYSAFIKSGFKDMTRISPSRPIMRFYL